MLVCSGEAWLTFLVTIHGTRVLRHVQGWNPPVRKTEQGDGILTGDGLGCGSCTATLQRAHDRHAHFFFAALHLFRMPPLQMADEISVCFAG